MNTRNIFYTSITALGLALASCSAPTIQKCEDLTSDGIEDIVVDIELGFQHGNWLFIGQNDGTFKRATQYFDNQDKVKYYMTADGEVYFFNGEFYELSPQEEIKR